MIISRFKYLFSPITLLLFGYISFTSQGIFCYTACFYAYILIPILELLIPKNIFKEDETKEILNQKNKLYDYFIYFSGLSHFALLFLFLGTINQPLLSTSDVIGRVLSMGLLTSSAINIGHELGHRSNKTEIRLAKFMLMSSLIMHFYIEHNRGHHKNVATHKDPASAIKNQTVFAFWVKSIVYSFISACKLEVSRLKKLNKKPWSFTNEIIQYIIIQALFLTFIYLVFGLFSLQMFLIVALLGYLSLETINYIEHYGLRRKKNENGKYERVEIHHSWNSNHLLGRLMLFELTRHSDHHYKASKKYQTLVSHNNAPQLPTGYPGMMILSLFPPLFFRIMNPLVDSLTSNN